MGYSKRDYMLSAYDSIDRFDDIGDNPFEDEEEAKGGCAQNDWDDDKSIDEKDAEIDEAELFLMHAEAAERYGVYERDPDKLAQMKKDLKSPNEAVRSKANDMLHKLLSNFVASCAHELINKNPTIKHENRKRGERDYKFQEVQELIQCGWEGIMLHIDEYDPYRTAPTTFFFPHVHHHMVLYIHEFQNRTTVYKSSLMRKIRDATDALNREGNSNPSIIDIAIQAGLRPSMVRKTLEEKRNSETKSMDEMTVDAGEYSSTGRSAKSRDEYDTRTGAYNSAFNPHQALMDKEQKEVFARALATLPDGQREVIRRVFGIGCDKESYKEISEHLHYSVSDIKSMETQAKNRLYLNVDLRRNIRGEKAEQIKSELNFEPVCITPDHAAEIQMNMISCIDEDPEETQISTNDLVAVGGGTFAIMETFDF